MYFPNHFCLSSDGIFTQSVGSLWSNNRNCVIYSLLLISRVIARSFGDCSFELRLRPYDAGYVAGSTSRGEFFSWQSPKVTRDCLYMIDNKWFICDAFLPLALTTNQQKPVDPGGLVRHIEENQGALCATCC